MTPADLARIEARLARIEATLEQLLRLHVADRTAPAARKLAEIAGRDASSTTPPRRPPRGMLGVVK